ncbi:MAG TPA: hypothetical protein VFV07_04995 [Rhizomicrobium sp.]|nr:hypothetical protein [Rhizomicrobium sp.]
MSYPFRDRAPNETPETKGVRGPVFFLSCTLVLGVPALIVRLLFDATDHPYGTIIWIGVLTMTAYNLFVEYHRPPGDQLYMRETSRWVGLAYLAAAAAVAAWYVLHHMYGFSIKP